MDAWIAGVLLVASLVGIFTLAHRGKREKEKKAYGLWMVILSGVALMMAGYLALTVLFLNAIQ